MYHRRLDLRGMALEGVFERIRPGENYGQLSRPTFHIGVFEGKRVRIEVLPSQEGRIYYLLSNDRKQIDITAKKINRYAQKRAPIALAEL